MNHADIHFYFDPLCPFAWVTSKGVRQVAAQRDHAVDWRFISLRMLNADVDYDSRSRQATTPATPPGRGSSDSARELARRATQLGDRHVDILVNNAAISPMGPTASMAEDDIDGVFAINVKVPFVLVGELAPAMARRGKGAIVNVGTMAAEFGVPGMSLYGASKAALILLTKAWAAEFGPSGVRVNAVNPGPTRTEGTAALGEAIDEFAALAPAGRPASPDEIAAAITYLASDDASFVHGAILAVDGGRTAA
jgi:NAD(P)-dependent dehydrogenase (short-subunit alcohol dehydrogenase family)